MRDNYVENLLKILENDVDNLKIEFDNILKNLENEFKVQENEFNEVKKQFDEIKKEEEDILNNLELKKEDKKSWKRDKKEARKKTTDFEVTFLEAEKKFSEFKQSVEDKKNEKEKTINLLNDDLNKFLSQVSANDILLCMRIDATVFDNKIEVTFEKKDNFENKIDNIFETKTNYKPKIYDYTNEKIKKSLDKIKSNNEKKQIFYINSKEESTKKIKEIAEKAFIINPFNLYKQIINIVSEKADVDYLSKFFELEKNEIETISKKNKEKFNLNKKSTSNVAEKNTTSFASNNQKSQNITNYSYNDGDPFMQEEFKPSIQINNYEPQSSEKQSKNDDLDSFIKKNLDSE